jgi:maltose alpha-D-glucosyltransferase/alpha-amylase
MGDPAPGTHILLANLLSNEHSRADGRGRHTVELEGYGYRWFLVGGLDYILRRSR